MRELTTTRAHTTRAHTSRARLEHHAAIVLLYGTGVLLAGGGLLHLVGLGAPGDVTWLATGSLGAAYAAWYVFDGFRRGRFGVDVIALLALLGAMIVGEYLAAGVISLMLASGRTLEAWAGRRARRDLHVLLERAPRLAHRCDDAGTLRTVAVQDVMPGDRILVEAGEVVPVDGSLLDPAVLDEAALTGESMPVERAISDQVRSGVVNAGAPFELRVTASSAESTYAGIVRLVEAAESTPAPFVRLTDQYAVWFFALALLGAAIAWVTGGGAARAVAVLVVATPCPLILAAPVAIVAGLSKAARRGVVIKGGDVLERLARCTTVLIDKTGTLTSGRPALTVVVPAPGFTADEVLCLAGSLDQVSAHVLATAVVQAAVERHCELELPHRVEEVAGQGIRGSVGAHRVALGKASWAGISDSPAWAKSARRRARLDGSLTVFVGVDDTPAGVMVLDDPIRLDAARTIRALRHGGISRVVMVSGDRTEVAETVGAVIGVDEVLAERTPSEKLDVVRIERRRAPTIMVGDGINDAPALALADVGVAMGTRGATASTQTADVVLTVDRLDRVGEAHQLARRSLGIALQSVIVGMAMSLGAMGIAALGYLPAVWGAILQEGIDVAVILNAVRALRPGPGETRLAENDAAITRRFQGEHAEIRTDIDRLRTAADCLGAVGPAEALSQVRDVHRLLVEKIQPHETAEQEVLYPALDRLLGGSDATGPMSRAHVEIGHQIRRLGQLLDDIGSDPDTEDINEMRRLLYGLHAVLRLHTAQEDESYLSLGDDTGSHAGDNTSPGSVSGSEPPPRRS